MEHLPYKEWMYARIRWGNTWTMTDRASFLRGRLPNMASPYGTWTMTDRASFSARGPNFRSSSASEPPLQNGMTDTNVLELISKAANVSTMRLPD